MKHWQIVVSVIAAIALIALCVLGYTLGWSAHDEENTPTAASSTESVQKESEEQTEAPTETEAATEEETEADSRTETTKEEYEKHLHDLIYPDVPKDPEERKKWSEENDRKNQIAHEGIDDESIIPNAKYQNGNIYTVDMKKGKLTFGAESDIEKGIILNPQYTGDGTVVLTEVTLNGGMLRQEKKPTLHHSLKKGGVYLTPSTYDTGEEEDTGLYDMKYQDTKNYGIRWIWTDYNVTFRAFPGVYIYLAAVDVEHDELLGFVVIHIDATKDDVLYMSGVESITSGSLKLINATYFQDMHCYPELLAEPFAGENCKAPRDEDMIAIAPMEYTIGNAKEIHQIIAILYPKYGEAKGCFLIVTFWAGAHFARVSAQYNFPIDP